MKRWRPFAALSLALATGLAGAQDCVAPDVAPLPDPRYVPLPNGTVYDRGTGLMWMQCPEGSGGVGCSQGEPQRLAWDEVKQRARNWRFAGHADWRLPTLDELRALLQRRCHGIAIDGLSFPGTPFGCFWTADPASYYPDSAWTLDFRHGHLGYGTRRDRCYARLVRDATGCVPERPETCLAAPATPGFASEQHGDQGSP